MRIMRDLHVSGDTLTHICSMKLTHLVGSSHDLENIALSRQFLSMIRERSIGVIYGHPGATFLPMDPAIQEKIDRFPELQDEWTETNPLYYRAMGVSQERSTHARPQLTSPADITTQAGAHPTPTSVTHPATSLVNVATNAPATSPANSTTSSKLGPGLAMPTYAQKTPVTPAPAPQPDIAIRITPKAGIPEKPHTATKTRQRPETFDPSLKDGWKAWVSGSQLKYANRPGGPATTFNRRNPVRDADKRLSEEKAPPKGFHFFPSNLNLNADEDPNLCRGIFENGTKCPFAKDPLRCQYRHYVHQSTLDFVVTKRGINKELIKWMLANYLKNTPQSILEDFAREVGELLHVPSGPSAYGLTPSGLDTTKTPAQREERRYPAASTNVSAASTTSRSAADTIQGSQLALHLSENKDHLRSSRAKSGSYKPDRDFQGN
jgi:hypothetical protein